MAVVLEIGPAEVRRFGGKAGDPEEVFAALSGIDDPVVLVDESPTETTEVWRALLASLMPSGPAESVRIVYPSWWTRQQVDLVVGATGVPARDVIAVPRRDLIVAGRRSAVVIEIAADLVAVSNGAELEARVRADVMEIVRIAAAWAPRKHPRSYSMHPHSGECRDCRGDYRRPLGRSDCRSSGGCGCVGNVGCRRCRSAKTTAARDRASCFRHAADRCGRDGGDPHFGVRAADLQSGGRLGRGGRSGGLGCREGDAGPDPAGFR